MCGFLFYFLKRPLIFYFFRCRTINLADSPKRSDGYYVVSVLLATFFLITFVSTNKIFVAVYFQAGSGPISKMEFHVPGKYAL